MFLLSEGLADSQLASLTPAKLAPDSPRKILSKIFRGDRAVVENLLQDTSDLESVLRLSNEHSPSEYVPALLAESEQDDVIRGLCLRLLTALAGGGEDRFRAFWSEHFDRVMIFVFEMMDELKAQTRIAAVLLLERVVLLLPRRCRPHLNEIVAQLVERVSGEQRQVAAPCERVLSAICADFPEKSLTFKILRGLLGSRSDPLSLKTLLKELLSFMKLCYA